MIPRLFINLIEYSRTCGLVQLVSSFSSQTNRIDPLCHFIHHAHNLPDPTRKLNDRNKNENNKYNSTIVVYMV